MKNKKIGSIVDSLFLYCVIILGAFIWSHFYIRGFFSIITALTISFCSIIILENIKQKNTAQNQDPKCQEYLNQFIFNTEEYSVIFFEELFKKRYTDVTRINNYLIIKTKLKTAVFFHMYQEQMTNKELFKIYNTETEIDKILILTASCATDATYTTLLQIKKPIKIMTGIEVYELMKEFNHYPKINIKLNKPKPKKLELLKIAFDKNNTRHYGIISLLFYLFSFLTPIKTYYFLFASLSLICAFICYTQVHVKILYFLKKHKGN